MKLPNLKNLFINLRPYNFVSKYIQKTTAPKKVYSNKIRKKFTSKHRYTHTTKKWRDIGKNK